MAQDNSNKVYFSIGEVATELGITVSNVRYWSTVFADYIKPNRNKKGDRFFTQRDLLTLKKVKYLAEDCGLKLKGAKARLDAERLSPKKPKPAGRPSQDAQANEADAPVMPEPDDLAIKADVVDRLTKLSNMLKEISKYL